MKLTNGKIEQWGKATTNTSGNSDLMLKVNFLVTHSQNPSISVSQNYNESGTSACLQSFNINTSSFQVNSKNASGNTYYARNFTWISKGY